MTPNRKGWSLALVASMVILSLASAANAKGKSGGGGSTGCAGHSGQSFGVTSLLADTDSGTLPFQIQSDGKGSYVTSTTDSVSSQIQAVSCDWVLDLTSSQSRTLKLSLGSIATSGATLPPGWPTDGSPVNVAARIISKCEQNPANTASYGTMTFAGQTAQCAFYAAFGYSGSYYAIRMDSKAFPGTDWAQVTCTGATSNQCNAWTVGPIPNMVTNPYNGQPAAISELQHQSSKGSLLGTSMGFYYVSFSATVHK